MQTTRIVLTEPFIRHPAGLVFELDAATGVSGWDDDERIRERQNYADKSTYHLPDGGNGHAYELPASATAVCPEGIFDPATLRTGPCRITRAAFQTDDAADDKWNPGFNLLSINNLNAQGFTFPLERFDPPPEKAELYDHLRNSLVRPMTIQPEVDISDLTPGFYGLHLYFAAGAPYVIRFIKSFPLLVLFTDKNGRYSVQKTLY